MFAVGARQGVGRASAALSHFRLHLLKMHNGRDSLLRPYLGILPRGTDDGHLTVGAGQGKETKCENTMPIFHLYSTPAPGALVAPFATPDFAATMQVLSAQKSA